MNEIWNNMDLKRPPLITLPTTNAQFAQRTHAAINRYCQRLSHQQDIEFAQTAALLSRLMARRKNSFRRMIGFRAICKLNAALCRLLRVDLSRDLERFRGALPDNVDVVVAEGVVELPTRQCLDYLLVRLVSVHRIHERIRHCCTQAADYFSKMLRSNFFLEINTLLLAVFAKLFCLSAVLGNRCVQLYGQLLPHRASFPQNLNAVEFLPENMELPARLEAFVNVESSSDTALPSSSASVSTSSVKEVNLQMSSPLAPVVVRLQKKSDMGSAVERVSASAVKAATVLFKVEQLATVEHVKRFIVAENKARTESPQTCATNEILKHEWLGAQKLFESKLLAKEPKKALGIFRKFIASKIKSH